MAASGSVGLGTHFANVLPDLAGDRIAGVRGLPQIVAARWGAQAVRAVAIVLLLAASVLLVGGSYPVPPVGSRARLAASAILALIGFRSSGKIPFFCALGIAAVDVVIFLTGSVALTWSPVAGPSRGGISRVLLPPFVTHIAAVRSVFPPHRYARRRLPTWWRNLAG